MINENDKSAINEKTLARQDNFPAQPNDANAIIQVIERAAMNPDVDIDKMERLLEMQERIINRNAETSFNAAIAQMQAEMPAISEKGEIRVNGTLRSKYARFEDINEAVKPILQAHGFAVSFRTNFEDKDVKVTAVLSHREGHREETTIVLPADTTGSKNNVQAIGSTVSYGKRYTMCALLNITTGGEDDDGNTPMIQRVDQDQVANLRALIQEVGASEHQFCKYMQCNALSDIQSSEYDRAISVLEKKRGK